MCVRRLIVPWMLAMLALVLHGMTGSVECQVSDDVHSALRQAESERWIVRAALLHGHTQQGRVVMAAHDSVRIDRVAFSTASIVTIDRLQNKNPWSGALLGSAIGAGVAFGIIVPLCPNCSDSVPLGLTFAAAGGVLGALISGAMSSDTWLRVWPPDERGH